MRDVVETPTEGHVCHRLREAGLGEFPVARFRTAVTDPAADRRARIGEGELQVEPAHSDGDERGGHGDREFVPGWPVSPPTGRPDTGAQIGKCAWPTACAVTQRVSVKASAPACPPKRP